MILKRDQNLFAIQLYLKKPKKKENIATAKVRVSIKFYEFDESGNKEYYEVTRELISEKWGDTDWIEQKDKVVFEDSSGKPYEDDDAKIKIEELIPKDMFRYFFFNGPSMHNYFDYKSDFNLRESIDNISQLDLITEVGRKINKVEDKLKTDRKNNKHDDSSDLQDKINDIQSKLFECKKKYKKIKNRSRKSS